MLYIYICVCVCHLYLLTYVEHILGLKGPSPHVSVGYSKINENVKQCIFAKCNHFGNTFLNIGEFPVYVDIRGNVISTVSIGISE